MELLNFWEEVVIEKFIDVLLGNQINCSEFTGRNVPIAEIAKAIKNAQYVRLGIQTRNIKIWNSNEAEGLLGL